MDDLRADEVQVLEDGKRCAVQSFRLVQAESGGTAVAPATGPVDRPAAKPETETARPAPTGDGLVSVVALVFDQLGPEAARNARAAALQLADRSFPKDPSSRSSRSGRGWPFCSRSPRTAPCCPRRSRRRRPVPTRPATRPAEPDSTTPPRRPCRWPAKAQAAARNKEPDARLRAMEAQMLLFSDSVTREGQGQASLQPLLAIARALSLVQGRKSLLYFSEGLAVPPSVEDLFQTTVSTGKPVERVGLRVRRARAARPLSHGRDEAGARPGPRDRLLRSGRRRRAR